MTFDWPRLARTALYRAVWDGRVPRALDAAPPLTVWQWRRHIHRDAGHSLVDNPALWVLYPVPGDDPIWIPLAATDIAAGAASARSMFTAAGLVAGDSVLAVAPPAPWAGNTLPYLFSSTDRLVPDAPRTGTEVFPLSVTTVSYKADLSAFPLSQRPSVVAGSIGDITALLSLAETAGMPPPRFRLAFLAGGGPSGAGSSEFADRVTELLYLPGLFAPIGGRPDEPGVWLPTEMLTAELVLDEEWARSVQDLSHIPRLQPLAESVGASGELVVTVTNTALPVVRLRTALRVRVAEFNPGVGARIDLVARRTSPHSSPGGQRWPTPLPT